MPGSLPLGWKGWKRRLTRPGRLAQPVGSATGRASPAVGPEPPTPARVRACPWHGSVPGASRPPAGRVASRVCGVCGQPCVGLFPCRHGPSPTRGAGETLNPVTGSRVFPDSSFSPDDSCVWCRAAGGAVTAPPPKGHDPRTEAPSPPFCWPLSSRIPGPDPSVSLTGHPACCLISRGAPVRRFVRVLSVCGIAVCSGAGRQ